jgi:dihydropteroate synthase
MAHAQAERRERDLLLEARRLHNPRVVAWPAGERSATRFHAVRLEALSERARADLEREIQRAGGSLHLDVRGVTVLGTTATFERLARAGGGSSPLSGFERLIELLQDTLARFGRRRFRVPMRRGVLELGEAPCLMGVVNVTPDSFSDGGRFLDPARAIEHGLALIEQGAGILDVGGESTRPGAEPVAEAEEIRRIVPVVRELSRSSAVPISIDTRKHRVAEAAIEAGASIVNDVSGLEHDPLLPDVARSAGAPLVINHMKGTPQTMQSLAAYDDLFAELLAALRERIARAIGAGVPEESLLVDPGIGFGKRLEHNLEILRRLPEIRSLGHPIVVGPSRKSFIGAITGRAPSDRAFGTAAAVAAAVFGGASVVRVHDVAEMRDAALVAAAIAREGAP